MTGMESYSSPELVPQAHVEEILNSLAVSDPDKFKLFFRHVRRVFPVETMRACLRHLACPALGAVSSAQILPWVKTKSYFDALLDSEFLSVEEARRAAEVLRAEDSQFFLNYSRLTSEADATSKTAPLCRALALLDGLKDYTVLFPWLRGLTTYPDERIQSQSVKAFCRLRSNAALITRQLQSETPRIRANALEALWPARTAESAAIFRDALSDGHHRVVINALIGLHYQGDVTAYEKLLEMAAHPSEMHRSAVVWALGHLAEPSAVPVLQAIISNETVPAVKDRATKILADLKLKQANNKPAVAA